MYIEDLSNLLVETKIGCYLNNQCMNHLYYADDAVLLAPTAGALQNLITVCHSFAENNEMLFNVKKSVCSAFIPKLYGNMNIPDVHLGGSPLKWVAQYKYLGAILDNKSCDDTDIVRQIQAIYARGNTLIQYFRKCSTAVKTQLFKSYCSSMYGCHLWQRYGASTIKKIQVAYNNVFRTLMGIKRGDSISHAFVASNVQGFKSLVRKCISGFYLRIMDSTNALVKSVISSVYFTCGSHIFSNWKYLLFIF